MNNSFGISLIPDNEPSRLAALHSYDILDSGKEAFFDDLAHLVASCFRVPIALISLVDAEHVFFKAAVGMPGVQKISRGISLCSLAILQTVPTVFPNALKEPCLLANPLVAGAFGLRFYAGAPIISPDGYNIGTLCIVDKQPREFSAIDKLLLARFAQSAMKGIEKRKENMQQIHTLN